MRGERLPALTSTLAFVLVDEPLPRRPLLLLLGGTPARGLGAPGGVAALHVAQISNGSSSRGSTGEERPDDDALSPAVPRRPLITLRAAVRCCLRRCMRLTHSTNRRVSVESLEPPSSSSGPASKAMVLSEGPEGKSEAAEAAGVGSPSGGTLAGWARDDDSPSPHRAS